MVLVLLSAIALAGVLSAVLALVASDIRKRSAVSEQTDPVVSAPLLVR